MAAGSGQAPSPDTALLSKDDLGTLYNALYPARNSYKSFGLQIDVGIDEIDSIEKQHTDPGDRLLEVLSARLRKEKALTWNDIDRVLRLESVGQSKTANSIRKALFSPDPSTIKSGTPVHEGKEKPQGKNERKEECSMYGPSLYLSDKQEEEEKVYEERVIIKETKEKRSVIRIKEYIKGKGLDTESEPHEREGNKSEKDNASKNKKTPESAKIKTNNEIVSLPFDFQGEDNKSEYKEIQQSEEREKGEIVQKEAQGYSISKGAAVAIDEQYSHEEVRESSALKSMEVEYESEDEYFSCQEELIEVIRKPTKKHKKPIITHIEQEHQKKPAKRRRKYKGLPQKMEDIMSPCQTKEKDKKGKKPGQVINEKVAVLTGSIVKTQSKQRGKQADREREVMEKSAAAMEHTSDSTQEDFENSDSDDSSEDEEDRDSEEESSNEEEEREGDQDATSEEEVKAKSGKAPGGRDKNQEGHDSKPKKKKRRRHRESSMSPTARGSSSPSTSQEDSQNQPRPKGKGTKEGKQKRKSAKRYKQPLSPNSSEIDSSSPECDMGNGLSETEKKKLSGIFSRFFGKLCCAIVNPVEIAAQLQEKCLISKATMIEMLKSPESQQDKTIGLVSKLNKKIDSHPDRLFVFIEVLLQSDVLQRAGKEMLKEAGKACPRRAAVKFPNQLLLSTDTVGSLSRVLGKVMSEKSPTATPANRAPLEVGQFLPEAGISPVLTKYKEYLQSCYNARVLAPADKYLPTLEAPYINLAIIKRGQPYNPEQRDKFTRQTLHGGVDQILENKTPINIEDLLTPEDSGRLVRFTLVEGPPGIGKSTFAWEVCRRWDEIESLRDYHTVLLLKLREKWVLNATKPSDIFRFPPEPELSATIAKSLSESHGRNILLVLDGFDEVSHSFHENSVIKSILCRKLLPECTIILTTRPSAKHTLKHVFQPRVDKHVEIIGFTEEERVSYITEVFSKEPELQVNFLKHMFLVPHIKSMMYIPLNCAIIAQVYYESQSSHHLAIPRTRTQLYEALTHSLLVRHMKMKDSNYEGTSMLPESLSEEEMKKFETLAKFAFDSYHKGRSEYSIYLLQRESKKVTFFKEDIPEGLVHFGFMNESTEMYAGKGVERTFSFLHLSLQEYLAAWHLASSYSIEFQVAYHRLAVEPSFSNICVSDIYKSDDKEEEALLSSLEPLTVSLVEPAIFLAGVTGWRCQSEDDRNHWEMYLSHDTAEVDHHRKVLLRSVYEVQNPKIISQYFSPEGSPHSRSWFFISSSELSPYDCYALSYCLSHFLEKLSFEFEIENDDDVSLLEIFVKGLDDHCKSTRPQVGCFRLRGDYVENSLKKCMYWLNRTNDLTELKKIYLESRVLKSAIAQDALQSLVKFQSLLIHHDSSKSWEWLPALKSITELRALLIYSREKCSLPPTDLLCWLVGHRLEVFTLNVEFPSHPIFDLHTPTDILVDSVLKSSLRSNQITELALPNISRETMAGANSILLHCPSLTTLRLRDTRLGYDGILYICSGLRNNTTLRHLVISEDIQFPTTKPNVIDIVSFSSMEAVPLPGKTTCTDFLLELNNILKDKTTLEDIKIQSGLFLPLFVSVSGYWQCCQWTGLGPLQQFNVGAVGSGMSPNLWRSFSSSDLTQPQTTLFWKQYFGHEEKTNVEIDFKRLFPKKEGKKLFSLPSFTAPDTEVLQSFSGLDPRLRKYLKISNLHQYVETLRNAYQRMLTKLHIVLNRRL